jgi:thiol-disulfide isomerase/thioredoxin
MLTRGVFLISGSAALTAASARAAQSIAVPTPAPASSVRPTASPQPWDLCEQNPILPYDRPLGLRMRVLDGPDFDLQKYRGYAVVLNIFATWCAPCNAEMPALVASANKYYDRGLRIIGINYAESDDTVRAYRKKYSIPFPIAMDERGGFSYNLEHGDKPLETAFPVSLYISPEGYLYCYKSGSANHPDDEITYRMEKFLRDDPPQAPLPSARPAATATPS